jgi:glycosyltransferase involved in cell wall biosynthesis
MISKVYLLMWTKNGESFLPRVLKRLDGVIPREHVNQKILVDDHSADDTIRIAKDFNWTVYNNPVSGISSGANEALRQIKTEFFISLEQDILLAKEWWDKIPPYMRNGKVVCAQGVRVATNKTLQNLDYYTLTRKDKSTGPSIDNNIFRTKIIRAIGGFPTECPTCTDTILFKKILNETPYKWIIDHHVVSLHLRESVSYYIKHAYELSLLCAHTPLCVKSESLTTMTRIFLSSPLRATVVTAKTSGPHIFWAYPLIRFMKLKGALDSRNKRAKNHVFRS